MIRTIAIILLALSTGGAGYFGWTQKKSSTAATAQVAELTEKVEEADKKIEAAAEELAASKELLPPLMTKVQELDAVKAAFSTGVVLKDLEAAYAKEKKGLSPERQLGLAGVRLLTNGTKDPATVEAFQKALEMTDWKAQQKVICAAQNALAAAGQKVKVMSECLPEGAEAKKDSHGAPAGKADAHAAPAGKDAHGKDAHGKDAQKDSHGTASTHAAHWEYQGAMGPENWGKEFPTCGRGKSQAPLNIKGPFEKVRFNVAPDYKQGQLKVVNNGHTIQVNVPGGSKIRIDGKPFDLVQFHFHRPSEEHIDGKPSAMVIHFVHKNAEGELAVLGVMLREGNENPGIKTLWTHAPKSEGPEVVPDGVMFNPANLLPREMDFFHYDGSLTTPPCTEKVKFYILKTQVNVSKEQMAEFPFKMNARPIQPANGRPIYTN
ncbi:carbonic anhydrase [Limnohabitans sp. Rim11]|jgi:carbonic anhydrase|uniref:carbonic anhydrase n=1 Tax=Limnohabitans sp. Rim11 TaxID=1100719 RepID=UPI000A5AC331|nr:carbonic anhydrase family protein [Limnohabitans sp. Rim11]